MRKTNLLLILIILLVAISACSSNEVITNDSSNAGIMETLVNDNGVSLSRLNRILDYAKSNSKRTTDEIEVAYFGLILQPYKDINGVDTLIDTLWIYFKDGTFEQYANTGDEVVLFSIGNYKTKVNNDFRFNKSDIITINRESKYKAGVGLDNTHKSSHDYDINKLNFIKANIRLD